jgi:hypothetical protein
MVLLSKISPGFAARSSEPPWGKHTASCGLLSRLACLQVSILISPSEETVRASRGGFGESTSLGGGTIDMVASGRRFMNPLTLGINTPRQTRRTRTSTY